MDTSRCGGSEQDGEYNLTILTVTQLQLQLRYSIRYKNGCLATSDLFHMFTQSVKFYIFHYHVLRVQMFEKCDISNIQ